MNADIPPAPRTAGSTIAIFCSWLVYVAATGVFGIMSIVFAGLTGGPEIHTHAQVNDERVVALITHFLIPGTLMFFLFRRMIRRRADHPDHPDAAAALLVLMNPGFWFMVRFILTDSH